MTDIVRRIALRSVTPQDRGTHACSAPDYGIFEPCSWVGSLASSVRHIDSDSVQAETDALGSALTGKRARAGHRHQTAQQRADKIEERQAIGSLRLDRLIARDDDE